MVACDIYHEPQAVNIALLLLHLYKGLWREELFKRL